MKKVLLAAVFLLFAAQSFAQTKFGLYLSPAISSNRIQTEGAYSNISVRGVSPKVSFGPTVDYMFSENASLNTGLIYAPKSVRLEGSFEDQVLQESYLLQYLQVPLGVKLYTNELDLDTKMYFQLGGIAEVKISQKMKEQVLIKGFNLLDASVVLGAGVERQVGPTNILFAGLSYKRGLTNVVDTPEDVNGSMSVKNDLIGLDVGIKF